MARRALFAFVTLIALSAFADQGLSEGTHGAIAGTVVDLDEGSNQLQIMTDDNRGRIPVITDAVSTQYNGFGGVINEHPEIFLGSKGFSNLRLGDRVEVRGIGRGNGAIGAETITLLGRSVPAGPTGVGDTRSPSSISTPTGAAPPSSDVSVYGRVEGTVRQVNANEGTVTIETDRREMITIRGSRSTPVHYGGATYQLVNLEPGDRIRVEPQSTSTSGGEVTARSIEVVRSVQESGGSPTSRNVTQVSGRVTRVERGTNIVAVDNGRGEVRVDLTNAYDSSGRRVRATDVRVGDAVTIAGTYGNGNSNVFFAATVRFGDEGTAPGGNDTTPPPDTRNAPTPLASVTIYGTVTDTLDNAPLLTIRDTRGGGVYTINVADDFVVRTKTGGYSTAQKLKNGDAVTVKAYRDADGNYIAQTIRLR
jgi:hypothetical protein